jgi:hypothetical protein
MPGEWLTVAEASQQSGYSEEYLRRLLRSESPPFKFQKVGRYYYINAESFAAFCEERLSQEDDARYGPRRPRT